MVTEVPEAAIILANVLAWSADSGPQRGRHVLDLVTAGRHCAVRFQPSSGSGSSQELAAGIAAPSANKFGQLSPTCAEDVRAEFRDEVSIVLDGGPCEVGIESPLLI